MNDRIVIAYNTSWYVWTFRMPLIAALRERGFEVVVLAPRDEYTPRIEAAGIGFRPLDLDSKGRNPLRELAAFLALRRAYRSLRPKVALQYTIKPNLYGSIAAASLGIPVVNNVTGLGEAFERGGLLQAVVRLLYRFAFRRAATVFFQNPDDFALFARDGLVTEDQARLLPGSGVDLARFAPRPGGEGPFTFLFVGRLFKAKGVEDLIEAARAVKAERPEARVILLGKRDDADSGAADPALLDAAAAEGTVEFAGTADDVRPFIAGADCVVLPSYYREGTPRSLLEAIAMGRPVIAADSVGTREPVREGENGFLCRPRDPADLARVMLRMMDLEPERRRAMGAASRALALERFDERIVIRAYFQAIDRALGHGRGEGAKA